MSIGLPRKVMGYTLILGGVATLHVMDQVDIVLNASASLPDNAYVMWEQPVFLNHGTIVGAQMPDVLAEKFGDHLYVKRIGGMPGDEITIAADGTACVNGACYEPVMRGGVNLLDPVKAQIIPADHYALFGASETSLDSRYDAIGLVPKEDLKGRGWPMPWLPEWKVLAEWF